MVLLEMIEPSSATISISAVSKFARGVGGLAWLAALRKDRDAPKYLSVKIDLR
jgi:hypothetical protein